ncbi:uncharacterized protein [Dermacentor andersoni]|uniref:uncharacterized protein isoform X2 n=1 Tax=Dermacentor andersoni TaxID=34620 RepID=UPI003B3ABB37
MKGNQTVTDTYATRVNSARSPRKRSRMRNTVVTAAECCRGLAADDVAASAVCVEWGPRAACGVSSSATICAPSQAIRVVLQTRIPECKNQPTYSDRQRYGENTQFIAAVTDGAIRSIGVE